MDSDSPIVDIRGKELYFIKMLLHRQQSREPKNYFTIDNIKKARDWFLYPEDFLYTLENKGLIRYEENRIYATDLAKRSVNEKEKIEGRLIDEQIVDDFEYAFLTFMNNRNEPVHMFDFPYQFKYHSKIHMQPVDGSGSLFYDWMDEIHKYIESPTIDGYILNHTGKTRFEKLKKEKALKAENERLDIEIKKQTIIGTRFSRNIAYASIAAVIIAGLVPLIIYFIEKDRAKESKVIIPEIKELLQTQRDLQQSVQDLQRTIQFSDTTTKKIRVVKK